MRTRYRPHVLGVDDGPFVKGRSTTTPLVGVIMAGADLVEGVTVREFPIDGADVTAFLRDWIATIRFRQALRAVLFSGVTIAGLAVIDIEALARELRLPVIVVNRRDPTNHRLARAFHAAGLAERLAIVERTPAAFPIAPGLRAAVAGISREQATRLISGTLGKAEMPEPIRIAHMIARALVTGESRGRV